MSGSANYKKGSFLERLLASILDTVIVLVAGFILSLVLQYFPVINTIVNWVFYPLYASIFLWKKGATPGKMLLKLKVLSVKYEPLSFRNALVRETVGKFVSGFVIGLGYLWLLLDKKNQTWHDMIAETYVIKTDPDGKLVPIAKDEVITIKRKVAFGFLVVFNPQLLPALFLFMYLFLLRPFQISGDAMNPNYKNGQYYISQITKGPFNRGDVIVFHSPTDRNKDFIKRVIGLPGDTVKLEYGMVYINSSQLDELTYLESNDSTYGGTFLGEGQTVTVPQNHYFVLGDNRPYSSDSREWGFLQDKDIIGKMLYCYWKCE